MKTTEKNKSSFKTTVRINPELNKYQNIILFPEKLAKANKMLETMSFSEQLRKNGIEK